MMDDDKVEGDELTDVTGSISIIDGRLYSVEERVNTFKVPHCNWPFDSGPCVPLKVNTILICPQIKLLEICLLTDC